MIAALTYYYLESRPTQEISMPKGARLLGVLRVRGERRLVALIDREERDFCIRRIGLDYIGQDVDPHLMHAPLIALFEDSCFFDCGEHPLPPVRANSF